MHCDDFRPFPDDCVPILINQLNESSYTVIGLDHINAEIPPHCELRFDGSEEIGLFDWDFVLKYQGLRIRLESRA